MLFEFGSRLSGSGGISGGEGCTTTGGGECEGMDEGGDREVTSTMSTEGERARLPDD